ncbi:hypothetical protein XELAEV_18019155mg [Xenopus laevis]|uniref:SEA domain-containing protein n=1 Tax=Xenopus laevis TaxID=8355 RepID=A0A974DG59_XENLA|nr:hypothetical protein XELAEV_18019155mg [Xenopus laevis]
MLGLLLIHRHDFPFSFAEECQNSGKFDGNKCVCQKLFFGSLCEFIQDRVEMRNVVNTTAKMNVTITNKNLSEIKPINSTEYEAFEDKFKEKIKEACGHIKEYKDVKITQVKAGSIIVDYDLILEITYWENINVEAQNENLTQNINEAMKKINNYNSNCSDKENMCFSGSTMIQRAIILSKEELCRNEISPGFSKFYTAKIIDDKVVCLSDCDLNSDRYYDCNFGTCQIQNETGPHCLCPNTDTYLYASEKCDGQMLKSAVYGSVGAAIAVLGVIIASVGFLLYRSKKNNKLKPFAKDQEDKWYEEDNDNEWSSQSGFSTINRGAANGEADNTNGSYPSSNNGSFRAALQNVDTTVRVKIRRPIITNM